MNEELEPMYRGQPLGNPHPCHMPLEYLEILEPKYLLFSFPLRQVALRYPHTGRSLSELPDAVRVLQCHHLSATIDSNVCPGSTVCRERHTICRGEKGKRHVLRLQGEHDSTSHC
jgi:hypothetical protein